MKYTFLAGLLFAVVTTWVVAGKPDLASAAGNGDIDVVKKILAEYPTIIKEMEANENLVLRYAAEYNKPKMIEFLISKGAKVDQLCDFKRTALFYALEEESIEAAKMLIKHGANVNLQDKRTNSLLHVMGATDKAKSITYLLSLKDKQGKYKILIDAKNRFKATPLLYTLESSNFHGKCALLLINAGADCKAIDSYENTPLHFASKHAKASEVVKALVKNGADLNAKNDDNETPLYLAVKAEAVKVVATLLELGAKVDDKAMKAGEDIDSNKIIDLLDKHSN